MKPTRYESLDVWRGVACLLVVAFHSVLYVSNEAFDAGVRAAGGSAWDWAVVAVGRCWVGVPLFFVVSGYCIAASADATRAGGRVGRYFARRARRIYPPLWAAIALAAVVAFTLPPALRPGPTVEGMEVFTPPSELTAWQWAGNLTLTESWRSAAVGPGQKYALGQLWTLCYEEQFYLVVGLILLAAPRWFFPCVWGVTLLVMLNLADGNAVRVRVPGVFTDGLWIGFAAGVAVYYRLAHAPPLMGAMIEFVLVVLALAAARSVPDLADTRQTLGKFNAAGCAFAVALCRLHRFDARLAAARWAAPLRFCGRMCYSLYLTHPVVVAPVAWALFAAGVTSTAGTVLITLPACVLLAVGLGHVFHRAVERRFLNTPTVAGANTLPLVTSPATRVPPCPAACLPSPSRSDSPSPCSPCSGPPAPTTSRAVPSPTTA